MKPDQYYMSKALKLAERGRYSCQPNPRVGCVVVKNGQIVGQGFHRKSGEQHAELIALDEAAENAVGADVFVTLEPCSHSGKTPPCADALIKARAARVVVAMEDPNPQVSGQGIERLVANGIDVISGVCEAEAMRLNSGFIRRMKTGRPFVRLKLATSLDGRLAMASGESAWITSPAARADVHRTRLDSCAVLTGINTVLADDPKMTARLTADELDPRYHLLGRQPVRVVLDSNQRLPADAALRSQAGTSWQIISAQLKQAKPEPGVFSLPVMDGRIDLHAVLEFLGKQEINNLLVEAGGTLAAAFIEHDLVDELVVYQAPDIMGASAQAMINLPHILKMSEKIKFEYRDVRTIGRDLKFVLTAGN